MPVLFWKIATFLAFIIGPIVARILAALGMAVVTYTGVEYSLDQFEQYISAQWSGLPANVAGILAMAGFDSAITIMISAVISAYGMVMVNGAIKRIGFKKGA